MTDARLEMHDIWTDIVVCSTDDWINDLIKRLTVESTSFQKANWEYAKTRMIKKAESEGDHKKLEWATDWNGKIPLGKAFGDRVAFPSGLIQRVMERLKIEDISMTFKDERKYPMISSGSSVGFNPKFSPRDYQLEATKEALKIGRGIIKAPTGSGKTAIAGMIISRYYVPTLVLVHKLELIKQWVDGLHEAANLGFGDVGIVQGSNFNPSFITICSVSTLQSWLRSNIGLRKFRDLMNMHPGGIQQVFFDEVHGYGAEGRYDVAMRIRGYFRFGLSATPTSRTEANLRVIAITGPVIVDIPIEPLQKDGWLSKMDITFLPVESMYFDHYDHYRKVYKLAIVFNDSRNNTITDIAIKKALEGHKVLIFVDLIEHGEILEGLLTKKQVTAVDNQPFAEATFVHGTHPQRESIMDSFKGNDTSLNILVATEGMIGEGWDYRELDVVIIANGGKGAIRTVQRIGRGQRIAEGKTKAEIYDFGDRCKYLLDHAKTRLDIWKQARYEPDVSKTPYLI